MKIKKLYFRGPKGELRNLTKTSKPMYDFLEDYFFNRRGNLKYDELNRDIKSRREIKPLPIEVPKDLGKEFLKLTKGTSIVIYFNSSWRACAKLSMKL